MKKILVVVGTRPELIKMAPVIHALRRRTDIFETMVCHTGQHRELSDQVIEYLNFRVDQNLDLMKKGQNLSQLTAALLDGLYSAIDAYSPNVVLVQGDTTTAFTAALAGFYRHVDVGHVEAGLRTHQKYAPFPEELNRRMIGALADHHFAPTERAKKALLGEGVDEGRIVVTGNTVIDSLFLILDSIRKAPPNLGRLEHLMANGNKIVLITAHRRENFGDGLKNVFDAIRTLAELFRDCSFVYPVHLNPNVQKAAFELLGNQSNVYLCQPMGYIPFVRLMNAAHIIITDSGGIQEEAPSLGKPVLVIREITERPEAIESCTAVLVGTDKDRIIKEASRLITDKDAWNAMSRKNNPFGDGKAAERIVDYLAGVTA